MEEVKERVNSLEYALGSFIIQTEKAIFSMSNEVKSLSREMKDFKDEMKEFKDEMKEFKDEMKEFKTNLEEDRKKEAKEWNRKWGELSNRLGSIAEDIAAPGLQGIINRYFNLELDKRMDTLYIRNAKDKENIREFDAVAITEEYFFVCEIKSTPRSSYVKEFVDLINSDQVYDYFPEYKDKKLVPVFSSFELPANIIKNLTKNKILAMAMGEEHMEIVNKEVLKHWGL